MKKTPLIILSIVCFFGGAILIALILDSSKSSPRATAVPTPIAGSATETPLTPAPAPAAAHAPIPEQPLPAEGEARVKALIERLGGQEFAKRLWAEEALQQMGQQAMPHLEAAVKSHGDEEVRLRSQKVIKQILTPDPPASSMPQQMAGGRGGNARAAQAQAQQEQEAQQQMMMQALQQQMPDMQALMAQLGVNPNAATRAPRSVGPGSSPRDVKAWHDAQVSRILGGAGGGGGIGGALQQMMQGAMAGGGGMGGLEGMMGGGGMEGMGEEPEAGASPVDDKSLDYQNVFGAKFEVKDGGLQVVQVNPGSLASGAGLKAIDFITQVNGRQVASVEEARDVLDNIPSTKPIKFEVTRSGNVMTITIPSR